MSRRDTKSVPTRDGIRPEAYLSVSTDIRR
jgi:hypothetical protein